MQIKKTKREQNSKSIHIFKNPITKSTKPKCKIKKQKRTKHSRSRQQNPPGQKATIKNKRSITQEAPTFKNIMTTSTTPNKVQKEKENQKTTNFRKLQNSKIQHPTLFYPTFHARTGPTNVHVKTAPRTP